MPNENFIIDENERARFRSRRMFQMDMEHNFTVARDEGREIGRVEGREIGREEGREVGREEGREIGLEEGREIGREEAKKDFESLLAGKEAEIAELRAKLNIQHEDK